MRMQKGLLRVIAMSKQLYLCDRRACKHCSPECRHTKDITHAKNFELGIDGVTMVEKEDKMWQRSLIKNKLYALVLMLIGVVPILIDRDGTFFIFTLMLGLPLFFAKENWIT